MDKLIDLLNRGEAKYQAEDYFGAIEDFSKVIELDASIYSVYFAYFGRGQAKSKIEDFLGAIDDYGKAIKLVGDGYGINLHHLKDNRKNISVISHQVHLSCAVVKSKIKDYSGAIADYSKAIKLNPDDFQAYAGRGEARLEVRDFRGAIEDFSKVTGFFPHNPLAYIKRGQAKSIINDHAGAIDDYSKVIKLNPYYWDAYDACIEAYKLLNDYYGARNMQKRKAIAERESKD